LPRRHTASLSQTDVSRHQDTGSREESVMHATTVAIDLAKEVFELAFADASGHVLERKRLSRKAFSRALDNQGPLRVLMEACGSAHYWGRRFAGQGHAVKLIPARDVRPYVRRNKTDRTDVAGMLEADRCADIAPVPLKTPEQQGIQALHRIREQLKHERTAALNLVRGVLREFGVVIPMGAAKVRAAVLAAWRMATMTFRWRFGTHWPSSWRGLPAWSGAWWRSRIACRSSHGAMSPRNAISRCPASA